jgi:hypothetical protein
MFIDNKWFRTSWRLLLIGVCLWGILLNVLPSTDWFNILSYYTLQSNIIVLVFFIAFLIYSLRLGGKAPSARYYTVKGAVTMCITLTLLIFHFLLRPTLFSMSDGASYVNSPMNIIVHYVVPLMVLIDWLLFDRKGHFRKTDPLIWTIIPWAYFAFSLIRAQFAVFTNTGSRYPYFFIDIDKYGVGQVALNVLIIAVGYVALGYLFYGIDLGLARITQRKKPRRKK